MLFPALLLALATPQSDPPGTWGEPFDYPPAMEPAVRAYVQCLATEWGKHAIRRDSAVKFDEVVVTCRRARAKAFIQAQHLLSARGPRGSPESRAATIDAVFDGTVRQYRYHVWTTNEALQRIPRQDSK